MIPKKRDIETAITINLLVARAASSNKEQIKEETQRMAAAIVQNSNIRISRLDLVYKKEDVEAVLQKNTHDVILMNETIGTDSIGSGSIKNWKKINPRVKLILILPDSKKAGMKISQLYHAGFYNVIFLSDFSGNTLVSLILSERSQEEAREYYGIKEIEEASQDIGEMETSAPVAEVAKEIINEDPVKFMEAAAPDLSSEYPDAIQGSNTYDMPDQNGVLPEANFTDIDIKTLLRTQAPDVNERKEIKAPWHELPDVPKSNVDEYGHALEKQVSPTFPEAGKVTNQKVYEQDAQSDNHRAYYDNNKEKKKMENVEDTMERTSGNRFRTTTMNPIREVNRMAASDTKRHLPREYYEEKMEFFDEDDQVEMPVKKNLPFEPKFAGGKKELPAQFKEINVDPTVSSYGGYVIKPISDTVLLIEVPDAHFLSDVHVQEGELINLITSRL